MISEPNCSHINTKNIKNYNHYCVCVCVAKHQPVECVQIMRWWSSNLRQRPLRNLGSVANCYLLVYLSRTLLSYRFLIYFRGGGNTPLLNRHPTTNVSLHRIIYPPGRHLSPSQNTDAYRHNPNPRCPCYPPPTLPHSCHACRIPVASAPLMLTKLLPP